MVDLSVALKLGVLKKMDAALADAYEPRDWLGLSQAGHPCGRFQWYQHHGYQRKIKAPDARILEIFDDGDNIEEKILTRLGRCGYIVTGHQARLEVEHQGICLPGHIDGMIEGLEESKKTHLLEIKSAKYGSFNQLEKLQSYKNWSRTYYGQIQIYMLLLELDRSLVIVYSKNDGRKYAERVRLDRDFALNLLDDCFRYISADEPPHRICKKSDCADAKMCNFQPICFGEKNAQT